MHQEHVKIEEAGYGFTKYNINGKQRPYSKIKHVVINHILSDQRKLI